MPDLRSFAVDEIHWITANAPEVELWVEDRWLAVAARDDGWMLSRAQMSGQGGATLATSDFTADTALTDAAIVAGAGVIARPASAARFEGLGARDVIATTSRIWLIGLVRGDSDAAAIVSVQLLDQAGTATGQAIRLHRSR